MAFLDGREGQPAEQLVVVLADDVAADEPKSLVADEPAGHAVDGSTVGHLVLQPRRRARGEEVRRLGEMGVAVDDLDAGELRMQAGRGLGVVDLADDPARRITGLAPVVLRGLGELGVVVRHRVLHAVRLRGGWHGVDAPTGGPASAGGSRPRCLAGAVSVSPARPRLRPAWCGHARRRPCRCTAQTTASATSSPRSASRCNGDSAASFSAGRDRSRRASQPRRPHRARADGVHPDAPGAVVEGGDLGHAVDRLLGAQVPGQAGLGAVLVAGADVDDRAAATFQHRADLVLHAEEDAGVVDPGQRLPVLVRNVGQRHAPIEVNRIVHRAVEAAVAVDRRSNHRLDLVGLGDVGRDERRRAAGRLDQLDGLFAALGADVGDHHLGAFAGEEPGAGAPQAAAGAGDERNLTVERTHDLSSLSCR